MKSVIRDAVAAALVAQPWWARRKDTLVAIAGTVLQVANVAAFSGDAVPGWVAALIAVVVGVCQIIVHAGTKGAVTPSMADRLEAAAPREDDGVDGSGLPVLRAGTSAP